MYSSLSHSSVHNIDNITFQNRKFFVLNEEQIFLWICIPLQYWYMAFAFLTDFDFRPYIPLWDKCKSKMLPKVVNCRLKMFWSYRLSFLWRKFFKIFVFKKATIVFLCCLFDKYWVSGCKVKFFSCLQKHKCELNIWTLGSHPQPPFSQSQINGAVRIFEFVGKRRYTYLYNDWCDYFETLAKYLH